MRTRGERARDSVDWDDEAMVAYLRMFIEMRGLNEQLEEYLRECAMNVMDEDSPGWDQ